MQSILGCRGASRTNLAAAANATKVSHQEPHGTPHKRAAREPRASYSSVLLRSASLVVPFLGFRAIRPPTKHGRPVAHSSVQRTSSNRSAMYHSITSGISRLRPTGSQRDGFNWFARLLQTAVTLAERWWFSVAPRGRSRKRSRSTASSVTTASISCT